MKAFKCTLAATSLALLAACGGGGGGGGGTVTNSIALQGVAATGAAISGGTVDVKCKNGTGTATTNSDGTYTVTVVEGAQPCILRATDPVTKVELFSIVESGGTTANITPVTSLVVANALGDSPNTAFQNFSQALHDKITAVSIINAVERVKAATAAIGPDADMTGIDIMKGTFKAATDSAAGDEKDKKLDALMAALTAADKRITDLTNQLKTATTANAAASGVSSVIGDAKYSLGSCPYARSGNVWVLNFLGAAPVSFNADFNSMVLKRLSDNSRSEINFKRDSLNNVIPCAFTATISGVATEFRISEGGIGAWTQSRDFGMVVPVQKTLQLTDPSFAGTYPSVAFLREKTSGNRAGFPVRFEIDSNGGMTAYQCDMTKAKPDCLSSVDVSSADPISCTPLSNGAFSCTSAKGLTATGILYVTGSQATMFMSITNMNVSTYRFGGLMVMTKAAKMSLPVAGTARTANSSWYTGVDSGRTTVVTGGTSASVVESVDAAGNSYITSSSGSTVTFTRFINTPANGLLFSRSSASEFLTLGSPAGWSVAMAKAAGTDFDGWYTYIRAKR